MARSRSRPSWRPCVLLVSLVGASAPLVTCGPTNEGDERAERGSDIGAERLPSIGESQFFQHGEVLLDDGPVQVEHRFRAINAGDAIDRVDKIVTTCGCLQASFKEQEVHANGVFEFDLSIIIAQVGRVEHSAIVSFASGATARLTLQADGLRSAQLLILPSRLIAPDDGGALTITLHVVDRAGSEVTATPTVRHRGGAWGAFEFAGWRTVQQQNPAERRPRRQIGELTLRLPPTGVEFPARFEIAAGSDLTAQVVIDRP
jgi:hypothetical protein